MTGIIKITQTIASARLANVPHEKRFWCSDGKALKNLSELESALEHMSEETFIYHANESKNDFSNWVRDVIGDEKLSRDLQKCKTQTKAAKTVSDRINWLKKKTEND